MSDKTADTRIRRRVTTLAATAVLLVAVAAPPAFAGQGGTKGPCGAESNLGTLGGDVSFVARYVGTPLPQVFAFGFEGAPDPMPPGQLMQWARNHGLC